MKTNAKSLVALAAAITLGLGFTSCSKDEPKPDPEPTPETTFNISLWLSSEIIEYYDIDMQYTDADGKVVSVNIKDCPESTKEIPVNDNADLVTIRTFSAECKSNKLPTETSIMVKYTYNGNVPADDINVAVGGSFLINGVGNNDFFRYFRGIEAKNLEGMGQYLNETFGTWILKVDAEGNQTFTLGHE